MPKKPTTEPDPDISKAEVEDAEVVAEVGADEIEAKPVSEDSEKPEAVAEDAEELKVEAAPAEVIAEDRSDRPEENRQEDEHDEDHDEHIEEHGEEHERRGTLAGRALSGLIILLVGAAIALWAAPRVAPHLPAGISQFLETGSTVSEADLAEIRGAFDGRMRALEAKTLGVATVTELVDTQLGATRATLDARVDELADKIAAADSAAIESRLAAVETALAGLQSEFASLSAGLTNISDGGAGLTPEDAARIAGFAAAVDGLRGEISSLSQKSGALSQRIDDVAAAAARRVEEAETEVEAVRTEAETAVKGMALAVALDELEVAVDGGASFAVALADLAEATGTTPPAALASVAETGAPSLAALRAAFPDAAHQAIKAAVAAEAGEGFTSLATAWFSSQFTGLPVEETAGDDAPAILSRVAARLDEGDLDAALAEAGALPEAAASALSPWMDSAAKRRDAMAGMDEYRATLGANG